MRTLKKSFFILLLPLVAFAAVHKFYVSVTNVTYSEKDDALQITSRVFVDDLEDLLKERYDIEVRLDDDETSAVAKEYLEKYLRAKFEVEINGVAKPYDYIGMKIDADVVVFYVEVAALKLAAVTSIQIKNEMLTDLFDEQQNILHYKIKEKKKSFVLMKENAQGMLNL